MRSVLDDEVRKEPSGRRPSWWKRLFEDFDLLDAVGTKVTDVAGVPEAPRLEEAPRLDAPRLMLAARAVLRDPRQRRVFALFVGAVVAFSLLVGWLLVSGRLGDFYETIYTWFPGRPWTEVMRDNPWIYAVLAVALGWIPFALAPRGRWGRAFLTYCIFLIGFLGGHVFW